MICRSARRQTIVGVGFPCAWHASVMLFPSRTSTAAGLESREIAGATKSRFLLIRLRNFLLNISSFLELQNKSKKFHMKIFYELIFFSIKTHLCSNLQYFFAFTSVGENLFRKLILKFNFNHLNLR